MVYEIGVVYRHNSRLYLAVTEQSLLTFKDGQPAEVTPYTSYEVVRGIGVDELCERWRVTPAQLDAATAAYLTPSQEGIRPSKGSGRRGANGENLFWKSQRTVRMRIA